MKNLMQVFMLSCRQASELVEKKLLMGLSLREKVQLKVHTSVCKICSQYEIQSTKIDNMFKKHFSANAFEGSLDKSGPNDKLKAKIISSLNK
jgi:hypothetical protein